MLTFKVEWLEISRSCYRNLFRLLVSILLDYSVPSYFCYTSDGRFWKTNFQSFVAGLAASGALTSGLRLITRAAFEDSKDGLRKGASEIEIFLLLIRSLWIIADDSVFVWQKLLHMETDRDRTFTVAVLFFAISSLFELLCVLLYAFMFPKLPIVKYYRSKAASEGSKTVSADLAAGGIQVLQGQEVHSHIGIATGKSPEM